MIDLRPVAYVIGRILIVLAILMVAPAIIDWRGGDPNWAAFAQSAILTGTVGVTLALATANGLGAALEVRQAYLLTAGIWFLVPAFGALPFWMGAPGLPPLLAYFEAVSGITTTGATMIVGLDSLPVGMNLWRGMLNWTGGLGIAFIAMIFLPIMRVGGMQFFRTEGFDTFGKALPRATDIARQLLIVYVGLTVACIAVYSAIGMPPLGAVVHGFASIATGGFQSLSGCRRIRGCLVHVPWKPALHPVRAGDEWSDPALLARQPDPRLRTLAFGLGHDSCGLAGLDNGHGDRACLPRSAV
jgi:trk system potassium uptake protein